MPRDFYRALADMRRVTLHATHAQTLYEQACRIAVESGQALMAWIGLVQGDAIVPVAWAGPAREYTAGIAIRLVADGDRPLGPTAYAVVNDRAYVCNDFGSDERTQPWRERAARFGAGASIAFPIRRGGRPIGALNLYFGEAGSCDTALIDLIELMASDIAYALDHIDQQAARDEAERAASEHEMRLASIIDAALEAIVILDGQFRVVVFNRSASRMFGVPAADAIGQPLDRFLPPRYREAHRRHVAAFAQSGKTSRTMGNTRSLEALRSDGTVFPIEASISRVGEGARALLMAMIRDVTRLREAESALMARTAAEAANRAKTAFLSRISHELRTPLNAILGFAQLMRVDRKDPVASRQDERLEHIIKAGEHLCVLIDETLDVARIESGHMQMDQAMIELEPLLDTVVNMSQPQAAQAGVRLEAAYRPLQGLRLCADAARLSQVMLNLLSNAIKYNRPAGWVRVEAGADADLIRITVSDGGLGMTPQQLASLFDPFNRLGRESSDVPGTGLGLVLVKELVELMDGQLDIRSEAGEGTSVSLTLPRQGAGCEQEQPASMSGAAA